MRSARRAIAAVILSALLGACSTSDALSPVASTSAASSGAGGTVAVSYPRFGDFDPHEWKQKTPWHYPVHGTDVSKYQKQVDWHQARKSGISFAFIKATEGGDRLDDRFQQHWQGAKAAGVPRGAYHFYYFCRTGAEQAAWFIRNVPRERGAMPPVLDMEWNPLSPSCKRRPPAAEVQREMKSFLNIVEKHYGKKPIIYTSIDFFDDNELSTFRGYPYWLRSVAGHPTERYGEHPFTFWQYTGTGDIPGIEGNSDINTFNGSEAAWRKWLAANTH